MAPHVHCHLTATRQTYPSGADVTQHCQSLAVFPTGQGLKGGSAERAHGLATECRFGRRARLAHIFPGVRPARVLSRAVRGRSPLHMINRQMHVGDFW